MILLIISVIAIATNLILGLFVIKQNPKSATNRLFFSMSAIIAAWSAINYFSLYPILGIEQIVWVRLVLFCAAPLTYLYFLLIHTFPEEKIQMGRSKIWVSTAWIVMVMILTQTSLVFVKLDNTAVGAQPIPGVLIPVFVLTVTGFIGGGIYLLIKKNRTTKGKTKIQVQFLFYSTALMFALILGTVLYPSVILHNSTLAPYASLYTFVFVIATAYAIIRHRLFNIKAVVARSVVYTLLISIILLLYTGVVFGLTQLFHLPGVGMYQVMIYAALSVFVAATFQQLKAWLEGLTNNIFYKDRYDSNLLLSNLTKEMTSTLDLQALSNSVLRLVCNTMHIQSAAIYIKTEKNIMLLANKNFSFENMNQKLPELLFELNNMVNAEDEDEREVVKLMRKSNISVAIPLKGEHPINSVLLLGSKKSGDLYTDQDLQVIEIIGPELAVAVENAHNYQQVSEFNVTLRQEVDKATQELTSVNDQLVKKNKQLQELDRLKDEFISITSHELRTPLTAIRGYLWMAMHSKKRDENYNQYIDRAYISSERLIDLVNDTLDISRIESGRVQLNPEPTNLIDLAKIVVQELEPKAVERHQSLTVKTTGVPAALCDSGKIHQVMTNLVGNALKFTPEKGTITIHFFTDKNTVVTAVTDTGPGISPQDQKRLFQKFSRIENSGAPGTGLGLYLCQQIIELSKGKIWLDSQAGQGSTFFFSLPISHEQPSILPLNKRNFAVVKP